MEFGSHYLNNGYQDQWVKVLQKYLHSLKLSPCKQINYRGKNDNFIGANLADTILTT